MSELQPGFVACNCCARVWHTTEQKSNFVRVRDFEDGQWFVFCVDSNCPAVWLATNPERTDVGNRARHSMARRSKWR